MNNEKKDNRGGPRGGGRPPKGRVNITFRADQDVVEILREITDKSDYINNLIRNGIKK